MLSKTAWFKILIVKIQNLRVSLRFKAQVRFKASKGTRYCELRTEQLLHKKTYDIIYNIIINIISYIRYEKYRGSMLADSHYISVIDSSKKSNHIPRK